MLDDYSLRLLTEMGIDVYVPRAVAEHVLPVQSASTASIPPPPTAVAVKEADSVGAPATAEFLILGATDSQKRLCAELLRSLRMAKLNAALVDASRAEAIGQARGLLVLGESLARTLGADMPAQRQNEITWIVSDDPDTLARNAAAKRALWGEIKRLSRSPANRPYGA